ncbi:HYR domain-containing protein [Hyunsoonleella rubra]|uniref:HYR domain-containing protein n=1 Tax=Hyunsoonleella rubra TaxID=1737062 RepID=A0ABW5TAE3_9FLAO
MKKTLLLALLCFASISAFGQTWTGGGANTNWNNTDNWDNNTVPTASDDVIIPTGFTVTLNVTGSVKSIDVQGTSIFNMNTSFTFTDASSFGADTTVNWSAGNLNGNAAILNNFGTVNLISTGSKAIIGNTSFNNSGTFNISSSGDLSISDGTLNNLASGVIDMQSDSGDITWFSGSTHILNNSGTIKRTATAGEAQIVVLLNNNDGTIQVESGTLSLQNAIGKNLTDGTFNVFSGATLDFDTVATLSGTITGVNNGTIGWYSTFSVPLSATLNFTGSGDFNWNTGTLNGGGTLTNLSAVNLEGTGTKTISEDTTLSNQGTLNFTGVGDLSISDGILDNLASGVVDMQSDSGNITWFSGSTHILNNSGTIKRTSTTGEAQIVVLLNNNDGTIQVESGTLSLQNAIGKNLTDGTYNVFSGATLDFDTVVTLSGAIAGVNNGTIGWYSTFSVPLSATLDFTGSGDFNWNTGTLNGGGTLTNLSTVNLEGTGTKTISEDTTLSNQGTLNFTGVGDLSISDGILDNLASGVIDMQSDSGNITWFSGSTHILNNSGIIKRTATAGEAQIGVILNNTDGTIQVESGTLSLQSNIGKNFTNGIYNVFAGAAFDWDGEVTLLGNLTGTIDGDLNFVSTILVNSTTTATLGFSGTEHVNWASATLSGGGTLVNQSIIDLVGAATKTINGDTVLNNEGIINFASSGDLSISQGVVNNQVGGIIDLQTDSGNPTWFSGSSHILNNYGLLKRSTSTGLVQSFVELHNFGTIEVESGELEITSSQPFTNETSGIVKGIGVFDLPPISVYTNDGTFEPGLSPGTLTVQGDFESTSTSVLDIELNGLTPDTEHDVLAIIGNNNIFEGIVNVTMGFEGTVGDEFTIATTSGTIATANLQSPIENVDFDGKRYTFEVSYPDNNKVVLTITDKLDILPPDIITKDITVQLDNTGNVSIVPTDVDDGTTDNCTPTNELVFALDVMDFTCADLGDNIVMLTVTDNDGNAGSLNATVTVEDSIDPTVVTKNITVQLDASGNASIAPGDIDDGSSDNCTIDNLSLDITDFTCADLGANPVNLTATDQSGNSASASANVNVEDIIAPTVITNDITVQLDASGNASITTADVDNGSSDNCTIDSFSLDITDFTCADLGANTVNLTATDQSGNSVSASATVTVEDSIDPTVVTKNITVQLDASGNASITASDINDGSSDNCTIAGLSLDITDFTCADLGANPVNLTVTDQSGNSASAPATVTLEDVIDPVVTCPSDIIQPGDPEVCGAVVVFMASATDNCAGVVTSSVPTSGSIFPIGTTTVTVTATDASGNTDVCTFDVTVNDTEDPVVSCPLDIVQPADPGTCGAVVNFMASATDNCSVVTTSSAPASGSVFPVGTTEVTVTATDASGNTDVCTFDVTVNDTEDPDISCPSDFSIENEGPYILPDYIADNTVVASDNCGFTVVQSPVAGTVLPYGLHAISFTVTDDSGNQNTCSFNLFVDDTTLGSDENVLKDSDIMLYPNPTTDKLNIKKLGNFELSKAEIIDVSGKIVHKVDLKLMTISKEISLRNYESGVYFLKVYGANNSVVIKRVMKY